MTPERWQQVKHLIDLSLDQEPTARVAFVTRACRGDDDLLHEVSAYLRSAEELDREQDFLEVPAVVLAEPEGLPAGHVIGPYKVLGEIGKGGMGAVYLAERADQEFEQRVAIKVVKRGMDTDEIVRRFRHERQILAQLEHANIARLLDGGTTAEGLSYFVMEYVEGQPIDAYCKAGDLPERERLELFRTVCAAVHFAHQRLVVHRDLKPGNILVTADGDPKLLDFGIAKLLDPEAQPFATRFGGIHPLTPEYASPEQLRGEPVATLSDVYSLGVLLHLLISGELPAEARKTTGAEPAATETAPTTPSGTGGGRPGKRVIKVKGELGIVIAKAMHEEATRRYSSAGQLSEDVRRYLEGFPLMAKPDSFRYRAGKFVRRYPWQVGTAAAVLGLILASTATATVLYRRAEREKDRAEWERDRAESERQRAQATMNFLTGLFEAADPKRTQGRIVSIREVLDEGRRDLEGNIEIAPEDRAAAWDIMGQVYRAIGELPVSLHLHQAALAEREKIYGSDHELVAESLHNLATTQRAMGKDDEAEPLLDRAIVIQRRTLGPDHPDTLSGLNNYASFLQRKDPDRAEALLREVLAAKRRLYPGDHEAVAVGLNNLAKLLQEEKGDLAAAEPLYREALAMRERLAKGRPDPDVARSMSNLATLLQKKGAYAEAESLLRGSLTIRRKLFPEGHADLVSSLNNLGNLLSARGRRAEAVPLLRQAVEMSDRIGMSPSARYWLQRNLGSALLESGRASDAEPVLREALAGFRKDDPKSWRVPDGASLLGASLAAQNRRSEAEALLREGAEGFPAKLNPDAAKAKEKAQARWAAFQGKAPAPAAVPAATP